MRVGGVSDALQTVEVLPRPLVHLGAPPARMMKEAPLPIRAARTEDDRSPLPVLQPSPVIGPLNLLLLFDGQRLKLS